MSEEDGDQASRKIYISPRMTIEAMILSAADDLDAKINQVRQALAEDGEGEFTSYHSRLGRVLWRG